MNYIPNFVAIIISQERRKHSWKQETYELFKYKAFEASVGVRNANFSGFNPAPVRGGGLNSNNETLQWHFSCFSRLLNSISILITFYIQLLWLTKKLLRKIHRWDQQKNAVRRILKFTLRSTLLYVHLKFKGCRTFQGLW